MTRQKLPDRRYSENRVVTVTMDGGKDTNLHVTIGFAADGTPREVFCSSFKAGTAMNSVVIEACILISRLLQRGDTVEEMLGSIQKDSVIGKILESILHRN